MSITRVLIGHPMGDLVGMQSVIPLKGGHPFYRGRAHPREVSHPQMHWMVTPHPILAKDEIPYFWPYNNLT